MVFPSPSFRSPHEDPEAPQSAPRHSGASIIAAPLSGPDLRLPRETMGQGRRGQVDQLPSSNEQLSATKAANWRLDGVDHVLPLARLTGA